MSYLETEAQQMLRTQVSEIGRKYAAGCPLLLLLVSPAICATVIARFGTDAQKEQWLPKLASGEMTMAFAITEPDAGSNSHRIATEATRDGDDWLISGTKYYISGADEADAILVVTRTGGVKEGRARLSLFIVDGDAGGLDKALIPMQIPGPDRQFTLFFDKVRAPVSREMILNFVGQHSLGLPKSY